MPEAKVTGEAVEVAEKPRAGNRADSASPEGGRTRAGSASKRKKLGASKAKAPAEETGAANASGESGAAASAANAADADAGIAAKNADADSVDPATAETDSETGDSNSEAREAGKEPGDSPTEAADAASAIDGSADEATEIEALRAERDDLSDRFMRALAEAENLRKRSVKERREAEQYGGARLARDMLPVYDNLKRAVEAAKGSEETASVSLVEGVDLTMRELLNIFTKHGIEIVTPEIGEKFDPQRHEAMFEAPVPDTKAGDIIDVSEVGFMLHDRLLRAAKVGVSSTPAT